MDDSFGKWVKTMDVASGRTCSCKRRVWLVGGIYGCD